MAKKFTVSMTDDLTLIFDFNNRVLDIITDAWIIREKTKEGAIPKERDEEFPSNKKVRLTKQESQYQKFIQLFTILDETDKFGEGVSFSAIKQALITQNIVKEIDEINNLINEALLKDMIEGTDKIGFYRKKA